MFDLAEAISKAENQLLIVGTTQLGEELRSATSAIASALQRRDQLQVRVLYESDDELYSQGIILGHRSATAPLRFSDLQDIRDYARGLRATVGSRLEGPGAEHAAKRLDARMATLRLPLHAVQADNRLWVSFAGAPSSKAPYVELGANHPWRKPVEALIEFYTRPELGAKYLFDPDNDKQLIQLYDRSRPPQPRGDAPRHAFYDDAGIQRRSVWGFVFTRQGNLVLHKRGASTADNPGMWDKSFGGHIDTGEEGLLTAKRELVEEFYLPEAEHTDHMREDLEKIRFLGDWSAATSSTGSVVEERLADAYRYLPPKDWALFIPNLDDKTDELNRVTHTSKRYYVYEKEGVLPEWRNARFIADVFFAVAPAPREGDSEDSLLDQLVSGGELAAAAGHRIVPVHELLEDLAVTPLAKLKYTEDLYHFFDEYEDHLLRFARFVRRAFRG